MTDLSFAPSAPAARAGLVPSGTAWARMAPATLLAFAAAGAAFGLLARPAALPEPNLMLLLRFMAAVKGAAALGAALLLLWRQRPGQLLPLRSALAYHAGLALMALAPGLIWSLGPVAVGAFSFHAGLILFAVAALRDDSGLAGVLASGSRRRS